MGRERLIKKVSSAEFEDKDDKSKDEEYITSAEFENLLDELKEYAASFDVAEELDSVDALEPLFYKVMYNKHAAVREKAAEVVSAMVHNNPNSQRLVMEAKGLPPLLYNFTYDPDVYARAKALAAISSLIRNNKPGVSEFRLKNGYEKLRDALTSESVMLLREALNLIQYLLHENSSDCNIVTELGLPRIMMHLASSDDAEVREAALRCLLVLTRDEEGGNSGQLVKNDDNMKQVLQERIHKESVQWIRKIYVLRGRKDNLWIHSGMPVITSLLLFERWVYLCYLVRMHLAPDVASKLFEPATVLALKKIYRKHQNTIFTWPKHTTNIHPRLERNHAE